MKRLVFDANQGELAARLFPGGFIGRYVTTECSPYTARALGLTTIVTQLTVDAMVAEPEITGFGNRRLSFRNRYERGDNQAHWVGRQNLAFSQQGMDWPCYSGIRAAGLRLESPSPELLRNFGVFDPLPPGDLLFRVLDGTLQLQTLRRALEVFKGLDR